MAISRFDNIFLSRLLNRQLDCIMHLHCACINLHLECILLHQFRWDIDILEHVQVKLLGDERVQLFFLRLIYAAGFWT